ncbi:MAG: iron chelate uptake ABC transporter family permease subunit, partial [Methanomassiliicoccaceae archaeon]|nr:iron chelate uptake ABC transporter family permease subunit [Methanomassiliicoccaceae archaeon]
MNIRKNAKKTVLFAVALLTISPLLVFSADAADSDSERVLFDMGNGDTVWSNVSGVGTIDDMFRRAASDCGLDYSSSGNTITVNGVTSTTIGAASAGGSLSKSGATGVKVTAKWVPFKWDSGSGKWTKISDISSPYAGGALALGFYPDGVAPVETPEHPTAWTMVRGDAEQRGAQDAVFIENKAETKWSGQFTGKGTYSAVLSAQGYVFVKYGASAPPANSVFVCYTMDGNEVWKFTYPSMVYFELATAAIIGDFVYIPTSNGYIFKIPLKDGPGNNNENVITLGNKPYSSLDMENRQGAMPNIAGPLTGYNFNNGPGSLVYDSGVIYCGACNGMMYCFDLNLNLIWSKQMEGAAYFFSHTVYEDYLFAGALNGTLYAFDKASGNIIDQVSVYTRTISGNQYGSVQQVSVFKENGKYVLMFGVSDGRGLSSMIGGIGIYEFDGSKLSKKTLITEEFGLVANYILPVDKGGFKGVYLTSSKGLFRIDLNGNYELMNEKFTSAKAPMVLVNGENIYLQDYPVDGSIYILSLDGKILRAYAPESEVKNFSMAPPLIMDGWVFSGNDSGLNVVYGAFPEYGGGEGADTPLIYTLAVIFAVILLILAAIYVLIRVIKKEDKPFDYIIRSARHYVGGEDLKHNRRSKNRLSVVLTVGIFVTVAVFIACLCVGYHATMSIGEMFSSLFSAIMNGGADPSEINEIRVFESRLPRTLAALGVGVGLSIAGSMYQAIIRNPLVDPYIMGVSAGAGTAAVAVIAFDFTFFGLFASHSMYATAIIAM